MKDFPLLVSEGVAIVLIECAFAIVAGIDTQLKRAVGSFTSVLHDRLHRENRSGANVKRQLIEARAQLNFLVMRVLDTSPKVVPIAWGKADVFGVHHFCRDWGDKKIAAEEKITIVAVKLLRLRIFEKQRSHQGNAGACGFFSYGIKVRKQAVAEFNEFAANGFVLRAVNPRFNSWPSAKLPPVPVSAEVSAARRFTHSSMPGSLPASICEMSSPDAFSIALYPGCARSIRSA